MHIDTSAPASHNNQSAIDALTVAAEFLLCAIRAAACGADIVSDDVRKPVEWAQAKLREAGY